MKLFMLCRAPDDGAGGGSGAGGGDTTVPVAALQAERQKAKDANDRAAAAEKRIADIEAASKAAEDAAAAKNGEFEKLYGPAKAELDTTKGRLAELERRESERVEKVKARNDARIKALPEKAAKALAPIAASMPPEALADWMDDHLGDLVAEAGTTRPAGTMAGNGGKKNEEPIPAETTEEWAKYGKGLGISERDWFEKNWKPRHKAKT